MALFKYFKPKHEAKHNILPDPHGPLAAVISPSAIETANQCFKGIGEISGRKIKFSGTLYSHVKNDVKA